MIIDCHGHYTTAPAAHEGWRKEQIDSILDSRRPDGFDFGSEIGQIESSGSEFRSALAG